MFFLRRLRKRQADDFPLGDVIIEPRIWSSGVIWRVRKIDNIIVRADRKALDVSESSIFKSSVGIFGYLLLIVSIIIILQTKMQAALCQFVNIQLLAILVIVKTASKLASKHSQK